MNMTNTSITASLSASHVIVAGMCALAIAMGIGRFAFTPLLPLMLRDGTLEVSMAHYWASANYLGYLIGALTATLLQRHVLIGLKLSLLGIGLMTLATGWTDFAGLGMAGAVMRFGCGICSAWALVCASSWCLTQLLHLDASSRSSWIYTGVGVGIALTGLITWLAGTAAASTLWTVLGLVALIASGWLVFIPGGYAMSAAGTTRPRTASMIPCMLKRYWRLILCYTLSGFGYILPATYLPALARQQTSDAYLFGLTWPLFGTAALASVAFVALRLSHWPHAKTWALAQGLLAVGVMLTGLSNQLYMLAIAALLVGGTFMVTTLAGLQLARMYEPQNPTPLLAMMTAGFAVGQIAGPVSIQLIGSATMASLSPLALSCILAALLLAFSVSWLWQQSNPYSS